MFRSEKSGGIAMGKRDLFTKAMAILGSIGMWIPILAPCLFSLLAFSENRHVFRFDYLMPLELFPLMLAGGAFLIWAAIRARAYVKWLSWSVGVAAGLLVTGQLLAVLMGWASGRTQPSSEGILIAQIFIGIYILAITVAGVGGILLIIKIFKPKKNNDVKD
jgi:hypothetical protein